MTQVEETVILERVIDLIDRGFPPRLDDVRDMADCLLDERDATRVGPRWAENFVRRQPQLKTRFRRRIDYQRALAEDPAIVQAWFALVRNTIAKYGIHDDDVYNFDETGFLMGMLSHAKVITTSDRRGRPRTKQPGNREWVSVIQGVCADGWALPPYVIVKGKYHLLSWYTNGQFPPEWRVHPSENGWTTNEIGLDWLKHFEKCTKSRTKGVKRLLILDGHNSHKSTKFDDYCKEHGIIALCMPPHSSHELQPLDVGCFSPLKASYGKEIEKMMRMQITHITKDDFFPAFKAAFFTSISKENVQAGFRQAGLVPFDPEAVLSRLDFKPKTPTPSNSCPSSQGSWDPKTPTT
ncbi:transposase, partial [Colletotrichum chrysophilum]